MFSLLEFQDYAKKELPAYFSEETGVWKIGKNTVLKNNGLEMHGITIMTKGSNVAPNIYIDNYYRAYQAGQDLSEIMKEIATLAASLLKAPKELTSIGKDFQSFDYVNDKIIMTAVNTQKNMKYLNHVPHTEILDLSLIYKVYLGNIEDGQGTITITNEHMELWGVTPEQIHNHAMENTRELLPITVQPMNEVMRELFVEEKLPDETVEMMFPKMPDAQQMYVVSNRQKINGAASMLYEDVLVELCEKVGSDLYILPSSTHEVIVVSANMGTPESMAAMVQDVNESQVPNEEQLSDHVYYFDAMTRELTLADCSITTDKN